MPGVSEADADPQGRSSSVVELELDAETAQFRSASSGDPTLAERVDEILAEGFGED